MKNKTTTWMFTAAAALTLFFSTPAAAAAEPVLDAKAIERMSNDAATPEDHAKVARQYRLRAESLEAKAKKHENATTGMQTAVNPMATKWPAMVRNGSERENRLAMEARRAAQECYARADHHIRLAVEGKLADGN